MKSGDTISTGYGFFRDNRNEPINQLDFHVVKDDLEGNTVQFSSGNSGIWFETHLINIGVDGFFKLNVTKITKREFMRYVGTKI